MHNLVFLVPEAQRNFCNELFDSVEVQRNSAIAERHFCTKLRSAIQLPQLKFHNTLKIPHFCDFRQNTVNKLLKKADIYQNNDRNETKLSSMYRIALLTEKKESAAQLKRNKF